MRQHSGEAVEAIGDDHFYSFWEGRDGWLLKVRPRRRGADVVVGTLQPFVLAADGTRELRDEPEPLEILIDEERVRFESPPSAAVKAAAGRLVASYLGYGGAIRGVYQSGGGSSSHTQSVVVTGGGTISGVRQSRR